MKSIFLRIYGGMLVALLLVSALVYGTLQFVNEYRAEIYREEMAKGTFALLATGTSRYYGAERDKWLQLMSALLGAKVAVLDERRVAFTADESDRLRAGRVVFRVAPDEEAADIYMRLPAEPLVITTRMTKVSEQQARATVVLILDALGQTPRAEWDNVFATIQAKFGFPLSRVPLADIRLDKEQQERLLRREVVISLSESAPAAQSGVRVYAKIGDTGEVLVLGPLNLFERLPRALVIPLGGIALVMMGLAAYLLVRPLERRLKKLERAVQQVSKGNLAARAEVRGADAVGQLAASFNGMTEHIQRLIQSQREMTRAVSHELRTPVARIRFGLEMLAAIDDAGEREQKIARIDQDIDQLDALIDEILTYARLEEGTPTLRWEQVDVAELARQVQRELQPIAGAIAIAVDAPEEFVVAGEERYLHRVLQNLIINAIRYARSAIVVRVVAGDTEVELVVEDDGPGIPEADRERVFKPFARLDDSRQRASGGYGLGLSIVQRIAEWHGGRVWVDQAPAGGAAFHLRWSCQRADTHVLAR